MEIENNAESVFGFAFSSKLKEDVRTAVIWAQIVAIIGFSTAALSLVIDFAAEKILQGIISTAINVFINIYLFHFARKTKKGIENIDQNDLEDGFNYLRLYFKVYSIIITIALGIIILAFISVLIYMGRF